MNTQYQPLQLNRSQICKECCYREISPIFDEYKFSILNLFLSSILIIILKFSVVSSTGRCFAIVLCMFTFPVGFLKVVSSISTTLTVVGFISYEVLYTLALVLFLSQKDDFLFLFFFASFFGSFFFVIFLVCIYSCISTCISMCYQRYKFYETQLSLESVPNNNLV